MAHPRVFLLPGQSLMSCLICRRHAYKFTFATILSKDCLLHDILILPAQKYWPLESNKYHPFSSTVHLFITTVNPLLSRHPHGMSRWPFNSGWPLNSRSYHKARTAGLYVQIIMCVQPAHNNITEALQCNNTRRLEDSQIWAKITQFLYKNSFWTLNGG